MASTMQMITMLLLIMIFVVRNDALTCLICNRHKCNKNLSNCNYGITKDICACCDVCAKGPGETCGGIWNFAGRCGAGLECKPNPNRQSPGQCVKKSHVAGKYR